MTNTIRETVTVSLDDSICGDSPSSRESDWSDISSDTSSNMSGSSEKFDHKSPGRRVHFDSGRESSKRERVERNRDNSPRPAATTATTAGQQTQVPPTNNPTVPGVAPYNNPAPIPTAGQQVFVHHTGAFNQAFPHGQPVPPTNFINYPGQPAFIAAAPVAMAGYVNPPNTGIHFQPQVPDTTNGPYVHTYHPRHDQAQTYQTYYVPAVGANVYFPPVQQPVMQPVLQQQQHVIQQPVIYQTQVPVPAAVCQCTHYYASGASSYLSLTLELQAAKWP